TCVKSTGDAALALTLYVLGARRSRSQSNAFLIEAFFAEALGAPHHATGAIAADAHAGIAPQLPVQIRLGGHASVAACSLVAQVAGIWYVRHVRCRHDAAMAVALRTAAVARHHVEELGSRVEVVRFAHVVDTCVGDAGPSVAALAVGRALGHRPHPAAG